MYKDKKKREKCKQDITDLTDTHNTAHKLQKQSVQKKSPTTLYVITETIMITWLYVSLCKDPTAPSLIKTLHYMHKLVYGFTLVVYNNQARNVQK